MEARPGLETTRSCTVGLSGYLRVHHPKYGTAIMRITR